MLTLNKNKTRIVGIHIITHPASGQDCLSVLRLVLRAVQPAVCSPGSACVLSMPACRFVKRLMDTLEKTESWHAHHFQNMFTPWASYQIRRMAGCACAGDAGNVFPTTDFERNSYPGMHHGTCVAHVSWCMSGSLTIGGGENVPAFPEHAQPTMLRIWQEVHGHKLCCTKKLAKKLEKMESSSICDIENEGWHALT